jgi:hypothetical protein
MNEMNEMDEMSEMDEMDDTIRTNIIEQLVIRLDVFVQQGMLDENSVEKIISNSDLMSNEVLHVIINNDDEFTRWVVDVIDELNEKELDDVNETYHNKTSTDCKFGWTCSRRACQFNHRDGRKIDQPCKFDQRCARKDCFFVHPRGRFIDN